MTATPLQRIPPEQLPPPAYRAWERLNELTGEPTFVEVFAQAPELLDFIMQQFYGRIFLTGRVAEKYKQLLRLYLSQLHGCRTCNKQNRAGALAAGLSEEQLSRLDAIDDGPFSDAEKAVLRLTEQMALTNHGGKLDQVLYQQLKAHFDDAEICELGVVMAIISGLAKLSFVMDLVEREDNCPFAIT